VVVSRLGGSDVWCRRGPWSASAVRTTAAHADLVICGGGHGLVSKALLAGVPMVVVPGGGDQWEIANRLVRQGSAQLVRPLTTERWWPPSRGVVGAAVPRRPRAGRRVAEVDDPVRVCHEALASSA
jgi:hypothetical protein